MTDFLEYEEMNITSDQDYQSMVENEENVAEDRFFSLLRSELMEMEPPNDREMEERLTAWSEIIVAHQIDSPHIRKKIVDELLKADLIKSDREDAILGILEQLTKGWTDADHHTKMLPDGYFYTHELGIVHEMEDGEYASVCSAIRFLHQVRDFDNDNWGVELEVRDDDGHWHSSIFRNDELGENACIRELKRHGLRIHSLMLFHDLLNNVAPASKIRMATKTGWHGDVFVTPAHSYCPAEKGEEVHFDAQDYDRRVYNQNGSLEQWKEKIAKRAIGNHKLAFVISAGFAAPLLTPLKIEGGGFHLVGSSSQGKSTLLECAYSVIGGSSEESFTPSWRTTDNAMEKMAMIHNHSLLALDEVSQVNSRDLYNISYMLTSGEGKHRANRRHSKLAKWRLIFLSTGEVDIAEKIEEMGKRTSHAGQMVRIVDIPIDAGAEMGAFEELHGFDTPRQLADELKSAVRDHHGLALPAFLQSLVHNRDAMLLQARKLMNEFVNSATPTGADGQVYRVCQRFALVAAAGELAIQSGILPWPDGFAKQAAKRNFEQWIKKRGTIKSLEVHKGGEAVFDYLRRYGKLHFKELSGSDLEIANKLGYRRRIELGDGRVRNEFIIPAGKFSILCAGHDVRGTLKELKRQGLLLCDKGRLSKNKRIPELGKVIRCNVIAVTT
jgi:putative DNA primase/helicase